MDQLHAMIAFLPGMPGWAEILLLAFVGLLLFGKRLPEVARSVGQSVVEFKKGMQGVKQDVNNAGAPASPQVKTPNALPDSATPAAPSTTPTNEKQPVE